MPKYFQRIQPDIIAMLAVIKKMLMSMTLGSMIGSIALPENINPFIPLFIYLLREGIGEFIRIARTGKIEDDGQ